MVQMSTKRLHVRLCTANGCGCKHLAKGLCAMHYLRVRRHGRLEALTAPVCVKTHGLSDSRIAKIFLNMKQRCLNPKCVQYRDYGGRGIRVEWLSLQDFVRDMGEAYERHVYLHGEQNTSIDRIDPNGNYSRNNCRWATREEQQRNRRPKNLHSFNGIERPRPEWCQRLGLSYDAAKSRMYKHNLTFAEMAAEHIDQKLEVLQNRLLYSQRAHRLQI